MRAIFLLAHIEIKRAHRLPNQYSQHEAYADKPWWLVETYFGIVRIGWRKRVIHIDWASTDVRGVVTEDDCTKGDTMVHAWGYAKAVQHLSALGRLAAKVSITPSNGPDDQC